jgi:hypothetical protein
VKVVPLAGYAGRASQPANQKKPRWFKPGLIDAMHGRESKKRGPKPWGAWGRETRLSSGLSGPPALRLSQPYWPSKRGEHSAGPGL